jgi:hypothetical protein
MRALRLLVAAGSHAIAPLYSTPNSQLCRRQYRIRAELAESPVAEHAPHPSEVANLFLQTIQTILIHARTECADPLTYTDGRSARSFSGERAQPEARDCMSRPPHWLLRSGTIALAGMLGLISVFRMLIKHLKIIIGRITIPGTDPVVALVARQSGHLDGLSVDPNVRPTAASALADPRQPASEYS